MSRNAVLLPPFLTEPVLTDGETTVEVLLKIFDGIINGQEAENTTEDFDADEDRRSENDNEKERAKKTSTKYAKSRDATD